jgi:NADH-quinone oxidoreductase subunit F
VRQQEALQRILNKETPLQEEMDLLAELDSVMRDASICGLGQTASSAIQSGIHRANLLNREGSNGDI